MKNGVFWDVTRATWRNIPEDTILQAITLFIFVRFALEFQPGIQSSIIRFLIYFLCPFKELLL
jgi:hypothetical protein